MLQCTDEALNYFAKRTMLEFVALYIILLPLVFKTDHQQSTTIQTRLYHN